MRAQIVSVELCEPSEIIRFEGMEWDHYQRTKGGHWTCYMSGSWEEVGKFEERERLYQEYKAGLTPSETKEFKERPDAQV